MNMGFSKFTWALGLVAVLVCANAAAKPVEFEIQAQPLVSAMSQFAQQSGLQVLFAADEAVEATVAPGVSGELEPEDALERILGNSELAYEFVNARTVAIHPINTVNSSTAVPEAPLTVKAAASAAVPKRLDGRGYSGGRATGSAEQIFPVAGGLPEVLVSGSKSLNADIERTGDDIQPYVVLGRHAIEESEAADVGDLLRSQPTMNYIPGHVVLRGLRAGKTIVLVDGSYSAPGSLAAQYQLKNLVNNPILAMESIEILPTTASGIYGGSATGGVVNVVLKHDYLGLNIAPTFDASTTLNSAITRVPNVYSRTGSYGGFALVQSAGSYDELSALANRAIRRNCAHRSIENSELQAGKGQACASNAV